MSHTPGPWQVDGSHVYDADRKLICQALSDHLVADRGLIAAAPDLLAACRRAKDLLVPELVKEPDRTIFWELVAAINKAEGKQ